MIGRAAVAAVLAAISAVGGAWAGGALDHGYARDVARPRGEVMRALEQLDIAGRTRAAVRLTRTPEEMVWRVTSGDGSVVRLIAEVGAIDPTHTRVSARRERRDAPDSFAGPALRSDASATELFETALDRELDRLTASGGDTAVCDVRARGERLRAGCGSNRRPAIHEIDADDLPPMPTRTDGVRIEAGRTMLDQPIPAG